MLVRRLLWNRSVGGRARSLPVVVLLGPDGSGKTFALKSISEDCGAGVIHARLDFDGVESMTTVEALARIADALSRGWKSRRSARFTRFTLGLIAVQTPLAGLPRERAKAALREAIDEFTRNPKADRLAAAVRALLRSSRNAGMLRPSVGRTLEEVLPRLIETVGKRPLDDAKNWHTDIPGTEGASPLDALRSLNERARSYPAEATDWLTAAFLADVREDHPRMAKPDEGSLCPCANPDRLRHWHNWVLLLDNIDQSGGAAFLADLVNARKRHLQRYPDDHDPLLIVCTSGRWESGWEYAWRSPWRPEPDQPDRARAVPVCRSASFEHWMSEPDPDRPPPVHYPVRLEPLDLEEIATILGVSYYDVRCVLTRRATGGLPAAVHELAACLSGRDLRPGARNVLGPAGDGQPDTSPWRARLESRRIAHHLPDIGIDEFIAAAPFATAPWLLPAEATSVISRARVGRILTELRTALWVTAPPGVGGTRDHAELHPWIARTLVSALAHQPEDPAGLSYTTQFEALLGDPDSAGDPARLAYGRLALRRIGEVVDDFTARFDQEPHEDWIARLALATRAPDNLPLDRDCAELYQEMVHADVCHEPSNRSPERNVIARLVAASWLSRNPFAVPDAAQRTIVATAYGELALLSRRPDVAALHTAAVLATDTLR